MTQNNIGISHQIKDENCIFCKIVHKEAPATILYEDEDVLALVPLGQVARGHTLVIPKSHYADIFDIDTSVFEKVARITKELSISIAHQYGASGVNLLNASGKDAQQSVFHFHMHIVPRYENDGKDLWLHEKL